MLVALCAIMPLESADSGSRTPVWITVAAIGGAVCVGLCLWKINTLQKKIDTFESAQHKNVNTKNRNGRSARSMGYSRFELNPRK